MPAHVLHLARIVLLLVTCFGLVAVPLQTDRPCCPPAAAVVVAAPAETHEHAIVASAEGDQERESSCSSANCCQAGDCCAGTAGAGCKAALRSALAFAKTMTAPESPPTHPLGVAPARRPANRDPDGLLQVPRAA